MNITIYLNDSSYAFPVDFLAIEEAMQLCKMGEGTLNSPITIDDFTTIRYAFPKIEADTKVQLALQVDESSKAYDPKLICVKLMDIGKKFNDEKAPDGNEWEDIFDCRSKHIVCTPDGILYISPNTDGNCIIKAKRCKTDSYLRYSILFSALVKEQKENKTPKRVFYIIDPLVKVSSGVGF